MPPLRNINTRAEYALYLLACNYPGLMEQVENFTPAMLAENRQAADRAFAIADQHTQYSFERAGGHRP